MYYTYLDTIKRIFHVEKFSEYPKNRIFGTIKIYKLTNVPPPPSLPLSPHIQIRGNRDLVGFLFNDFFLLVKPKNFFSRAATPAELEPFGKNEFVMYRTVSLFN